MDSFFKNIETISDLMLRDSTFLECMDKTLRLNKETENNKQDSGTDIVYSENTVISSILDIYSKKLTGIYLIDSGSVYLAHPKGMVFREKNIYKASSWYVDILKKNSQFGFYGIESPEGKNGEKASIVAMLRKSRTYSINQQDSLLRFDLNISNIDELVNGNTPDNFKNNTLLLLDNNNTMVFEKNNTYYKSSKALPSQLLDSKAPKSDYLIIDTGTTKNCIVYYTSPYSNWKTVCIIPVDEIFGDLNFIRDTIILLTLACLIIVLLFTFTLSSILLKPLKKLTSAMAEIKKGNFSTRVDLKRNDETRLLSESFNSMAENIETLINKVYNVELKQKEAELQALQNQINPHFLYNTMESIRGAALEHNLENIASMAKCLSDLFRYSISQGNFVDIGSEIRHLENYITIQNFRHNGKFLLEYDIPQELFQYRIIKLSLQPIVENSIKHGLEMKFGKGKIKISIIKTAADLIITLSDDGVGIPVKTMNELNSILEGGLNAQAVSEIKSRVSGTGIGLMNVNQRIKLYYGNEYGLIFKKSAVGTTIEIKFPAILHEGGD